MSQITTTDNHNKQIDSEPDLLNLAKIADVKIKDLKLDDNPNLLIFPRDLSQYGDKISESNIISLQGDIISTGNIMGFVGLGDTQLDIKSRFAQDDGRDYFLHYMLQKVFSITLFDIKHTSNKEQVFDFLLYLFPYYLKKALAQGLFKKYRTFEHNDANLRGVIDVSRHIRQNIPFRGTVAYNTRTHSYDNEITQLIRHTIEYIKTKPSGGVVLNNDLETRQCVSQIVAATPTYKPTLRDKIIGQNLRPVRHPYFGAYTALQNLCIKILRHESIKFGNEKDKVYGILFDGAWLWEEYLATFLKDFTHPHSKTDNSGKKMFCNPHRVLCQPDFFIDGKIVLDAKYKKHETLFDGKQREDRFQLLSYMHIFNASQSGLIVPSNKTGLLEQGEIVNGGTMSLYGLCANHKANSFLDYAKAMKNEENTFLNQI